MCAVLSMAQIERAIDWSTASVHGSFSSVKGGGRAKCGEGIQEVWRGATRSPAALKPLSMLNLPGYGS